MKQEETPAICPVCKKPSDNITYAPNPFASEINGDDTPVWMCEDCRYESAMDI